MKLKYKKMMVLLTTCAMGIGMVTLSFTLENKTKANSDFSAHKAIQSANMNDSEDNLLSPTSIPSITLAPTATPEPKNELEVNKYPEINELVEAFYAAKLTCLEEDFKPILTNANQLDMERLQRKIEYVKDYHNLKCYTKKGINEIDYIVYVGYDLELTTIDTYAPSIDELQITYVDGVPKIYLGDVTQETSNYMKELRTGEDVQLLVSDVVTRLNEACANDENLNEFYQNITNSTSASVTPTGSAN